MWPEITIDFSFGSVESPAPLPEGIAGWWQDLQRRNALSRAYDEGLLLRPECRRSSCPCCGAHSVHLTLVEEVSVYIACRKCKNEFELH